jgi:LEA14-like dessication related protein
MRLACRLAFLLVVAPLSACFLMSPVEKPTAVVRSASLGIASLTGLEGGLALDVFNPNAFGVPLAGIDWELAIGGAAAVRGRVAASQTIPAMGWAPVSTALRIDLATAYAAAAALARGARGYRLAVRLHFSTQLGDLTVDVSHQGSLAGAGGLLVQLPSW